MSKQIVPIVPTILANGIEEIAITVTEETLARKNELLELASLVMQVTSEEESLDAIDAASQLKAVEQGVEKSREATKKPYWNAGKAIDDYAKKFVHDITRERSRIEGLLTGYQLKLRKDREQAEALARAEAEERAEKERKRLAAEHAEESALAAAMEQPAPPPPPPVPVIYSAPAPLPEKMDGASFKMEWDYEVTDIHALYAWNRLFVKLEDDRRNLKSYLNMRGVDVHNIPGLRVFEKSGTITRAAKAGEVKVIE